VSRFGMPNHLLFDLQEHGHLSRVSILRHQGHSLGEIRKAVNDGAILRVARDWVATRSANQVAIIAVGKGGRLTGSTALASYGVWDATDRRIHVLLRPNAHGDGIQLTTPIAAFSPPRFPPRQVVLHWRREVVCESLVPWRTSVVDALIAVESQSAPDQLVACIDSALHTGALSHAGLATLFAALPQRAQPLLALIDGSAESGLESLARQRLRGVARTIETQVAIPGIGRTSGPGRVDLLLDSWLVIELDGDEFHDPKVDRARNSVIVRSGYRIHRFGYEQTIFDWGGVEATIRELLHYPPAKFNRSGGTSS
jgi:very-short-patch-repair endonuclease